MVEYEVAIFRPSLAIETSSMPFLRTCTAAFNPAAPLSIPSVWTILRGSFVPSADAEVIWIISFFIDISQS
jgi:hypothetical protein